MIESSYPLSIFKSYPSPKTFRKLETFGKLGTILNIKPINQLRKNSPIAHKTIDCVRIIGKNDEKIGHRCVSPLKTGVDVEVLKLAVVLHKSCPKNAFCKRQINARANQIKAVFACRKVDAVIRGVQGD